MRLCKAAHCHRGGYFSRGLLPWRDIGVDWCGLRCRCGRRLWKNLPCCLRILLRSSLHALLVLLGGLLLLILLLWQLLQLRLLLSRLGVVLRQWLSRRGCGLMRIRWHIPVKHSESANVTFSATKPNSCKHAARKHSQRDI